MQVTINYDLNDEEYKLYVKELDALFTSDELFKVIVIFNTYLMELYGAEFNVLKSDEIDYIMDSYTMRQMIQSNVNLLKRLNRQPSAFQESANRFGASSSMMTSSAMSLNAFSSKPRTNESTAAFDQMMSKRKGFSQSKFKNK